MIVTGLWHLHWGKFVFSYISQISYLFDKRLLISTEDCNSLLLHKCGAALLPSAGTFDCPKNIRPKISALTLRPRKKLNLPLQPSSIFSLWPGQANRHRSITIRRFSWAVIFETPPKYESGTEGKYYPIPIQEIRKSPFRSLVRRRSGLVTRKWVSRETSQRFPWGTR